MPKSKFFRVAVEGATVDGRTIDRKWLEEMAAAYNTSTYAARVNLEHIRGASPLSANTPFGSYGNILSLKVDTVDLEIGGKTEKRLALFAEIEPLDNLVELIRKGQKLYTSIEINPSFAETGKAYLMGLAVTDTPASLGTEMLEFSVKMGANSPLAARKQQPGNFFSVATETQIDLVDDAGGADPTGLIASMKGFFDRFTAAAPAAAAPAPAVAPAVETPPAPGGSASPGDFAAMGIAMGQMVGAIDKLATATTTQFAALRSDVDAMKGQINNTAAPGQGSRPLATGATQQFVQTDC